MKILKIILKLIAGILLSLLIEPFIYLVLLVIPGIIYYYTYDQQDQILFNSLLILYGISIILVPFIFMAKKNKKRLEQKQTELDHKIRTATSNIKPTHKNQKQV